MRNQRGLTMVEIMMALAILSIGALAMAASFLSSANLHKVIQEESLASKAILSQAAAIRARAKIDTGVNPYLNSILAFYSQSANCAFAVEGLNAPADQASVGQIILHINENRVPAELGADPDTLYELDGYSYGTLNIDGDSDTATDYGVGALTENQMNGILVAPVEIRITWQSQSGPITMRRFLSVARMDRDED